MTRACCFHRQFSSTGNRGVDRKPHRGQATLRREMGQGGGAGALTARGGLSFSQLLHQQHGDDEPCSGAVPFGCPPPRAPASMRHPGSVAARLLRGWLVQSGVWRRGAANLTGREISSCGRPSVNPQARDPHPSLRGAEARAPPGTLARAAQKRPVVASGVRCPASSPAAASP